GLAEEVGGGPGRAVDVRLELRLVELADQVGERRGSPAELRAVVDQEDRRARLGGHRLRPMLARWLRETFCTSARPTPPAAQPGRPSGFTRACARSAGARACSSACVARPTLT